MNLEKCEEILQEIAESVDGNIDSMGFFDNHGYATMSYSLPESHWLYENNPTYPPVPLLMGTDNPLRNVWKEKIIEAGKYAIRATTSSGKINDPDPDAWLQNLIVALLGYNTRSGLINDDEIEESTGC
jgi:hypothetical protein